MTSQGENPGQAPAGPTSASDGSRPLLDQLQPSAQLSAPFLSLRPPVITPDPVQVEAETVRRTLGLFFAPEQVFEVRVLDAAPKSGWNKPRTFVGYFRGGDPGAILAALQTLRRWSGVYVTLNRIDESLYARAAGRLVEAHKTAQDSDVRRRTLLLVDFDPKRASGISSTDAEQVLAIARARIVREYLCGEFGWPQPLLATSGNGAHLVFGIDLATEDGLVPLVLQSLHRLFSDESVTVDTTVGNPARISKLYGTLVCKGDSIAERPHRIAAILETPDHIAPVSREQLEALARSSDFDEAPLGPSPHSAGESRQTGSAPTTAKFDVPAFLQRSGIEVHHVAPWQGGTKFVLAKCAMDETHEVDHGSYVIQFANGAVTAGCHHERCRWGWRELRDRYEPRSAQAGASGSASANGIAPASKGAGLRIGDSVRPHDRNNYGTVVGFGSDQVMVRFVSTDGSEATVGFPADQLTPESKKGKRARLREPKQHKILTLSEVLTASFPIYMVRGLFDQGNLVVIYGAPASYKSFIAIDLMLRIAGDIAWHDLKHRTRKSAVLYVMAEGQFGLRLRVGAWMQCIQNANASNPAFDSAAFAADVATRFFAIGDDVPLFNENEPEVFLAALDEHVKRTGAMPKVIVIDTLARCFIGGDENSSEDMSAFIESCDIIRKQTGAAVILIHHTGKDGDLERGSSALRAGADCMIKAEKIDHTGDAVGRVKLIVEKRKDGALPADMVLDMWKIDLGVDAEGEPLSSLIPCPAAVAPNLENDGKRGSWRKKTAPQQCIDILQSLATTFDRKGASASNLRDDTLIPKSSFYKRLKELCDGTYVDVAQVKGNDVFHITTRGRERLSPGSTKSQSPGDQEGRPHVSEVSPPPLKGGGDGPETETRSKSEVGGS